MSHARRPMWRGFNEFTDRKRARIRALFVYARSAVRLPRSPAPISGSDPTATVRGSGCYPSSTGCRSCSTGCCSFARGSRSSASGSSRRRPDVSVSPPPSGPRPTAPTCCAGRKHVRPAVRPSSPGPCWSCARGPSRTCVPRLTSHSQSPRRDAPPPTGARPGAHSPLRCAEPDAAVWRCRTTYHHAA